MKKLLIILSALLLVVFFTACSGKETTNGTDKDDNSLKIGYIYINHPDESGWTYSHDQGRLYVDEMEGVETMFIDSVPEAPESKDRIRELIDQGCDVIIATSFGYMDYVSEIAEEFPEINFLHTGGYKSADNFGNYFGKIYNARYIAGAVSAMKSETSKIGYVAAFPYPELIRGINAFTLGAQSIDPAIEIKVIWTNSWYDPAKETQAAESLITWGADVLTQHLDSPATQKAAQSAGVWSAGYNKNMDQYAPEAHLISAVWNWGPYIKSQIEQMQEGTWKGSSYYGFDYQIATVSPLGKNAPDGTQEKVDELMSQITEGNLVVFEGPIYDNKNHLIVKEGQSLSDGELLSMEWFVKGVIPSLNK